MIQEQAVFYGMRCHLELSKLSVFQYGFNLVLLVLFLSIKKGNSRKVVPTFEDPFFVSSIYFLKEVT